MIVVSDTSPINYLALIGQEHLLQDFFGEIIIPATVLDELTHPGAPVEVRERLRPLRTWIRVAAAPPVAPAGVEHLDQGERDAILIAIEMKADLILIDQSQGGDRRRTWV